ncbi:mannose-1-phosphate guanylyltransferase/mannose-6-phosphate isomerase [Hydrogenophilus thiooxidans]|uniref:mannose-1-phosphate guanylyltransferase/mannose-6-phosphate isomerase n=1 Tax=Hydrogenophilus thiooxidans TaxID=2820326 RepID=UPI001C20FBCB|nr:mannose-1-phosphate guanylyltransferase/mannose-6-phosphate isomerase [Hydrogenophilus thiooxidans]
MESHFVSVILCGGAGSRLWPVSREAHPKPFIRLSDGQSLLQKAFLRAAQLPQVQEILTVTNRELFFKTEDEYQEVNARNLPTSFILEPFGRNTAAAIAAAVLHIIDQRQDAILLVLPADHLITDQLGFAEAVDRAKNFAEQGSLVTFGIEPNAPETGYGYIEAEGNRVLRFVEKPDAATALQYVESGRFFWNSGMFCFKATAMRDEMQKYCPAIIEGVRKCLAQSRISSGKGFTQCELDAESFANVPEDSIDYAVFEKSNNVTVVPCNIGWSDIGSWSALSEINPADAQGNRLEGEALLKDVENCYIRSEERLVGAVGVKDLIIVDTADALLVAHKERAQDVKHLYAELKARGHETHKFHRTVYRPWGSYTVLEEGDRYKIKRIVVKPGASLSLQMHHHRSEHWIVVRGMAKVVNGEREIFVATNESTYIPAGHRHRVSNPGVIDLVMIEVQSGEYLGEDDIVRFEDIYGRT